MKTMSFNVLCCGVGEFAWENRADRVIETIRRYMPDTLGIQESHKGWMDTLTAALPEYAYEGMGRDDGKDGGEFSPVFYKKDKFEKLDSGSFWVSEHPDAPGKGWDANCPRTCSWVKLKDKETGKILLHFNTHLDHVGEEAREQGAYLIAAKAAEIGTGAPAIITGDFNTYTDEPGYAAIIKSGFSDARNIAVRSDKRATYHDYNDLDDIIDFIFVKGLESVAEFRVDNIPVDGKYPSDHYPICTEFEL